MKGLLNINLNKSLFNFSFLFLIIVSLSCKKNINNISSNNPASSVTFHINDTIYSFPISFISKDMRTGTLWVSAQDLYNNRIELEIGNKLVSEIKASISGEVILNGTDYRTWMPGTSSSVSITSIHDNFADGTISAVVQPFGIRQSEFRKNISNGVFKNVPIRSQGLVEKR